MDIYEQAVRYTMTVLKGAKDWQEGEHALFNHDQFAPWIRSETADEMDAIGLAQRIVGEAEELLGDNLPANYG